MRPLRTRSSAGPDARAAARGFTLIELIVTMALIAILLAIAAPNFVSFQRNSQLTGTANSFIAAMATARAEAMRSNHDAYVVPNLTTTCTAGWTCGWYVFVDTNNDHVMSAGERQVIVQEPIPATITTPATSGVSQFSDGSSQYVLYNGAGFPRTMAGSIPPAAQSLDFAYGTATDGSTTRRIISTATGRMFVCTPLTSNPGCVPSNN